MSLPATLPGRGAVGDNPTAPTRDRGRSPRLKIALVCDWFLPRIGGIERHLAALAGRLAVAGHDVTVITPMQGAAADIAGVRIQSVPATLLPGAGLLWTPRSFRRLGQVVTGGNFDIVHAHASIVSPAAFAALYHAQRAGIPAIATMHSVIGGSRRIFRALDRISHWSQWPVVLSGVGRRVAGELRALAPSRPVIVLPNAVDPADWRLALRRPSDVVAIASVMRLVPRKRGSALLRALRYASDRLPEGLKVRLEVAGDGPDRGRLAALASSLGLDVRFLGACPPSAVRTLLAGSHFFVLPSRLEAFGIAALEARAAGLPVVAMREGGVGEFIVDGRDGLLADDDVQLANHLARMCTDTAFRERITRHNRETRVDCTWDRVLAQHLAVYARARAEMRL
ncbi:MAG TPA: glycosyltransferase family 4 protein [Opitutaceae bacterium]|nr:glycosyltransferase family 4 protein [Opitutaceae bacterium]